MARVTVEDCIEVVPNRFELVVLAVRRAHAILAGSPTLVEINQDKSTVVALREIAARKIDPNSLHSAIVEHHVQALGHAALKKREDDTSFLPGSIALAAPKIADAEPEESLLIYEEDLKDFSEFEAEEDLNTSDEEA